MSEKSLNEKVALVTGAAGAIGFGIGSNLVNNKLVEANDFDSIYQQACQYTQVINSL